MTQRKYMMSLLCANSEFYLSKIVTPTAITLLNVTQLGTFDCIDRESNPDHVRGRRAFYH